MAEPESAPVPESEFELEPRTRLKAHKPRSGDLYLAPRGSVGNIDKPNSIDGAAPAAA